MVQRIRFISQWVFFAVFLTLMLINKAQIWMGVIFSSIVLAAIFGRYYCGWMCPIHTLIRPTRWLSSRLRLTRKTVPAVLKAGYAKWIVLAIFLPALGFTIYTITQGRKFPLPVFIIGLGVLTTFFINEESWHRYLCPWGILLSATGKFAKFGLVAEGCTRCGTCTKKCPAEAVAVTTEKAEMTPQYCLLCVECQTSCPAKAIRYGS